MKDKIVKLSELVRTQNIKEIYKDKIACFQMRSDLIDFGTIQPYYTDTYSIIVIQKGHAVFSFNYKEQNVKEGDMILLYPSLLISMPGQSPDFRGIHLLCERSLFEHLLASRPAYKHYSLFFCRTNYPILHLSGNQQKDIVYSMHHVLRCILEPHAYQEDMLIQLLHVCLLQVLELLEERPSSLSQNLNHAEDIFYKFIGLLMSHYKKEHQIDFYAQSLSISSTYLSRIVRAVTHRTVGYFISGLLYAEACRLLLYTDMSVQAISDELCFSDQSAFGKFFKTNSSVSPQKYRIQQGQI